MATPYKTKDELIHQAIAFLGRLEPGEAPAPEDYDTVDGIIGPMLEQLSAEGIGVDLSSIDTEQVPNAVFLPLARLLANFSGPQIAATPMNEDAKRVDIVTLVRVLASRPTYAVQKAEYF